MRIERELMRGAGPIAVLKLLEHQQMYGYELAQAIAEETSGVLAMGQTTLYAMLYNLEAKRLIKGRWQDAAAADTGRRRKYYTITAKGIKQIAAGTRQWRALAKAMASIGILDSASGSATIAKTVSA